MADISKISPDDGSTILNIKDGNAVHWADNAVLGAVNIFPIDISTLKSKNTAGTWSGNTYTLNTLTLDCEVINGYVTTITANGTPTANVNFILFNGNSTTKLANKLKGKSITLSGCPINGSSNSYRMLFSTWGSEPNEYDEGSGYTVNVPSNVSGLRFDCIVYSGYTANNIVFKPMLSISPNAVYAPYAKTNRELTENVMLEDIYADFFSNVPTGLTVKGKGSTFISKVGKMVVGTVVIDNPNGFTSGTSYTLTIDDKYKPHENFNATGQFVDSEWDGITKSATGYMFLGNGGAFIIKQTSGQSLRYFKGQFAYTTL